MIPSPYPWPDCRQTTIIYALLDPFTQEPRYVGKTHKGLSTRMQGHFYKETDLPSSKWVHGLLRQGVEPVVVALAQTKEDYKAHEKFWIEYLRFLGADLLNRQFNAADLYKGRATKPNRKDERREARAITERLCRPDMHVMWPMVQSA